MNGTNPLTLSGDLSPLVQRTGSQTGLNRDGHVSAPEFAQFLDSLLHPEHAAASTPGLAGQVPPFRDRLVGFGASGPADPSADIKARLASLVQYLPPSAGSLGQISSALGTSGGMLGADGMTLNLAGGQGALGVRDFGAGPMWQFVAPGAVSPLSGS
jgi:hypothetical protein